MKRPKAISLAFSVAMLGVLLVFDTPGWFFPVIMLPAIIYLGASKAKRKQYPPEESFHLRVLSEPQIIGTP